MGLRLNLGYTVCPRRCRDGTSTVRIGPGNGHLLVLVLGRSIFGGCAVDAGSWRLGAGELSGLSCPSKSPVPQGPKRNIENTIQPVESSPSSPPRTGFLLGQCRQGDSDSKLTPQHDTRPHQSGLVCRLQHLDTLTGGSRYLDPVLCSLWLQGRLGHPSRLGRHLIPDRRRHHHPKSIL